MDGKVNGTNAFPPSRCRRRSGARGATNAVASFASRTRALSTHASPSYRTGCSLAPSCVAVDRYVAWGPPRRRWRRHHRHMVAADTRRLLAYQLGWEGVSGANCRAARGVSSRVVSVLNVGATVVSFRPRFPFLSRRRVSLCAVVARHSGLWGHRRCEPPPSSPCRSRHTSTPLAPCAGDGVFELVANRGRSSAATAAAAARGVRAPPLSSHPPLADEVTHDGVVGGRSPTSQPLLTPDPSRACFRRSRSRARSFPHSLLVAC